MSSFCVLCGNEHLKYIIFHLKVLVYTIHQTVDIFMLGNSDKRNLDPFIKFAFFRFNLSSVNGGPLMKILRPFRADCGRILVTSFRKRAMTSRCIVGTFLERSVHVLRKNCIYKNVHIRVPA